MPLEVTIRPLLASEVALAHAVETTCFPPGEAESLEAFHTRHSLCPAHFLGAFVSPPAGTPTPDQPVTSPASSCEILAGFTCATLFARPTLDLSAMTDPASHAPEHPYLVIHSLCVLPSHRGQGLARQLLGATVAEARRSGRKGARLMCHAGARAMYTARGWQDRGRSAIEYGGAGEEWWEMGIDLEENGERPTET